MEATLGAVVAEAGMPEEVARSLLAAARAGLLPNNPGVVLAQCLRFKRCLEGPLGAKAMHGALMHAPSLLSESGPSEGAMSAEHYTILHYPLP